MNDHINKLAEEFRKESKRIQKEVREKTLGYILAGLGVVAGLAWNDAIKALIEYLFPMQSSNSLVAQFSYAGLMTLLIVFASVYLIRLFKDNEEADEAENTES